MKLLWPATLPYLALRIVILVAMVRLLIDIVRWGLS